VWAMVFKDNMAAIGRSISCLNFFNKIALFPCVFSLVEMYDIGVDNKTASRMEHKNDKANARVKYNKTSPIYKLIN
jgi:hypothetical protein